MTDSKTDIPKIIDDNTEPVKSDAPIRIGPPIIPVSQITQPDGSTTSDLHIPEE